MRYANVAWRDEQGQSLPISLDSQDIYFSLQDGVLESHHVFIDGNDIQRAAPYDYFVIGEIGFGTALNFLCTALYFLTQKPHTRLHFVSFERYPLHPKDFARALLLHATSLRRHYPASLSQDLCQKLIDHYPFVGLYAGNHRIHLAPNICLDIYGGCASVGLDDFLNRRARADAWFLDGFSPKADGFLWQDDFLNKIYQATKQGGTLATFSAAGFVCRGLMAAGFSVQKRRGFGKKREMLSAKKHAVFYPAPPPRPLPMIHTLCVQIIGAGIAGLCCALALANKGACVSIIDPAPLSGGSGNPLAMIAPKFSMAGDDLGLHGYLYARRFYGALGASVNAPIYTTPIKHARHYPTLFCLGAMPWFFYRRAPSLAPFFLPLIGILQGALITPSKVLNAAKNHPNINFCATPKEHLPTVIATAHHAPAMLGLPPCRHIRGQISFCAADTPKKPYAIKHAKGYYLHASTRVVGASFSRNDTDTAPRAHEHHQQITQLSAHLARHHAHIRLDDMTWQHRAAIRAQLSDYHPVCGRVRDDLYAFYGLGARGFSHAPLLAEHLACVILGQISPISAVMAQKISPQRDLTLRGL